MRHANGDINRLAREEQVTKDVIVRDMLQSRFLSALFAGTLKREFALKGGLAMRAAFGSRRYTKDVDLQTAPEIPMARVRSMIESAIGEATGLGLLANVVVTAPKQTETVQRWKINGEMAEGGSKVNMTVEISRRGMPDKADVSRIAVAPNGDGEDKTVFFESFSPTLLAASKTEALLSTNRVAVRDLFDIYHLVVTMRVDPPTHILKKLGPDALAQAMKEVWPKLEMMTWDLACQDLLPSLPRDEAAKLDEGEWDAMRLRTAEAVTDWLQRAMDEARREGVEGCEVELEEVAPKT